MSGTIHAGYTVADPAKGYAGGEAVEVPLRHMAVTGQTQESGKTTTLEGFISRSGLQAVAYVTKRGESSFHVMHPIPPYFQERADWQFVQSLLEAAMSTKMDFKQPWIMRVSDGAKSLEDVHANIHRHLHGVRDNSPVKTRKGAEPKERWLQKPARRGMEADIYYVLDKYFQQVMPQIQNLPYSTTLDLEHGLNVMDLRDYDFAVQALVIRSVTDHIREEEEGTVNIIPEAWKFAPKQRGSPVRLAAEEYVREAAAMKNFLWIDSQDLAGVADVLMRQVGVWLFGVQRAKHEIERALDHMPEGLPAKRPRPADIATLSKGQFYVCFGREMHKVYVQPAWMTAAHAEAIARGEEEVDSAREILKEYDVQNRETTKRNAERIKRSVRSDAGSVAQRPAADLGQDRQDRRNGDSAEDRPAQASEEGMEEAMWKEKYEALRREFDEYLTQGRPPDPKQGHGANGNPEVWDPRDMDAIYRFVRGKLTLEIQAGDGILAHVLREVPEIEVTRQRRTVRMGEDTQGRIAILITEKFFDSPQQAASINKEFKRRGWFKPESPSTNLVAPLSRITEMGFLTVDGKDYQAVPGMKINIVEA